MLPELGETFGKLELPVPHSQAGAWERARKRYRFRRDILGWAFFFAAPISVGETLDDLHHAIETQASAVESQVIDWRRDIHAHPELGNAETRTSKRVAAHLKSLGLKVRTGIAKTGVIGILEGDLPGPVVALRADMDALPVKEPPGLSFASTQQGQQFDGKEMKTVDVMHACGHDAHTAMLMGAASVLAGLKTQLPGTVVFIFQPAEEGPSDFVPDGKKTWGAKRMIQEGALDDPRPDAIFGLHVWSGIPAGRIGYRPGAFMAASDRLTIRVVGRQTHAARPWDGVDPIAMAAQMVLGLTALPGRQTNPYAAPSLISFGEIKGGVRYNIIPDLVELKGTIRSYDEDVRADLHGRVRRYTASTAEAAGGTAEVLITPGYDATVNAPELTRTMEPTLRWAAKGDAEPVPAVGGAEDFSFFAQRVPGLFVFLGITPRDQDMNKAAPNHSPEFFVDESALRVGVRALTGLAVDYLQSHASNRK